MNGNLYLAYIRINSLRFHVNRVEFKSSIADLHVTVDPTSHRKDILRAFICVLAKVRVKILLGGRRGVQTHLHYLNL